MYWLDFSCGLVLAMGGIRVKPKGETSGIVNKIIVEFRALNFPCRNSVGSGICKLLTTVLLICSHVHGFAALCCMYPLILPSYGKMCKRLCLQTRMHAVAMMPFVGRFVITSHSSPKKIREEAACSALFEPWFCGSGCCPFAAKVYAAVSAYYKTIWDSFLEQLISSRGKN